MASAESTVRKQVRLVLEKQCREYADLLKSKVPAGVGFILFVADYGEGGNLAYVSTCERSTVHKMLWEWLDHEDMNHPAEGWQAAAEFVMELASAIGFEGEPEPGALLDRCRELAGVPSSKRTGT